MSLPTGPILQDGWVAVSVQGLPGGQGHDPPGLFLDHQGLCLEVSVLTSWEKCFIL